MKSGVADSGNKTCSLLFLVRNIGGLYRKVGDGDFRRYVEHFGTACLVETFVNNSYDLTKHFTRYDKYVSPDMKLCHQSRRSGVLLLGGKKKKID